MIKKAIIPVAGWGTRRLPVTKVIEKCMLPIGNRPIVDYVVEDCIKAGITDIYFVVGEKSRQLQEYYGENTLLNEYLESHNRATELKLVTPPTNVTFHYVRQKQNDKYGTAIPVALCRKFVREDESVLVLMGDDFVYNQDGSSEVKRLIEKTPKEESSMLSAQVAKENVVRYGVLDLDEFGNYKAIVERPSIKQAPSNFINISKFIINPALFREISEYTNEEVDGEYMIIEPMNRYVEKGGIMKVIIAEGQYLDGGNLKDWVHANEVVTGGDSL